MRTFIFVVLFTFLHPVLAQTPVEIISTANDPVGRRLVYEVKEQIRQSNSLQISLDASQVGLQAHIVTLERNPRDPGNSTVYSLVITWNNPEQPFPFLLTQYTGYCGTLRSTSCANDIVAAISEQSDDMIRLLINASKR